ncbi:holo-ACP synthase [Ideonella sp. DXS29W]|uniref:Holo-[acyl-carrier-protein] synthase n=1 Tax=Ideonella lacteola TaxID=2984193 RepID=A0ABU9BSW2_9BURK
MSDALAAADLVDQLTPALQLSGAGVRVGIDTVSVAAVADSLAQFGERFLKRYFSAQEVADARAVQGEAAMHERLAARFAAKEAVIKALDLPEAGVAWCDIELLRAANGRPSLRLNGRAAEVARSMQVREWAVSISHEREQACAVVVALLEGAPTGAATGALIS